MASAPRTYSYTPPCNGAGGEPYGGLSVPSFSPALASGERR